METTIQVQRRLPHHPGPPVSKLSAEVLSYIFILNVTRLSRHSLRTSVNSSQVCRFWRAVILSYPELWSLMIFLDSPTEWLNELLRRSEPFPIHAEWSPSYASHCLLDRTKYTCFPRFRSCTLRPSTGRQWELISMGFQVLSAPHLTELQLAFGALPDHTRPLLPSSALQLNAPSLRSLTFSKCGPAFVVPSVLSNVTTLVVVDWYNQLPGDPLQTCPPPFHWLEFLSEIPQISTLTISRSMLRNFPGPLPNRIVSLPNLKHLDLSEQYKDISLVLSHIRFPTSKPCTMQLFCENSLANSMETASIISVFTQNLERQALAGHELHTLKIGANSGMHEARFEFSVSAEKTRDELEVQGPWAEERLSNELIFYDRNLFTGGPTWLSYLEPILTSVDRSLVAVKSISLPREDTNSALLHHLTRASGVETLVRPSPAVIASLISSPFGGVAVPLPNLRNIIIFDWALVKDEGDSFSDLCTLLRSRISAGKPIKHIWLRYCSISLKNAEILRDFGVDVRGEIS